MERIVLEDNSVVLLPATLLEEMAITPRSMQHVAIEDLSIPEPALAGSQGVVAPSTPLTVACSMGGAWPAPQVSLPAGMTLANSGSGQSCYLQPADATMATLPPGLVMAQPAHAIQATGSTVFFAGVTPIATTEDLLRVFANFGHVIDINLFKPYKDCRTSKGCGLVVFSQYNEAAAALETLNGRFVWPGARSPMVIEWSNPSQHNKKKGRPQQQGPQPQAAGVCQQVLAYQQQAIPLLLPVNSVSILHPHGTAGLVMHA